MNLEGEISKIDKYLEIIRKIGVRKIDTAVYFVKTKALLKFSKSTQLTNISLITNQKLVYSFRIPLYRRY